jgi:hypothetical protein
MNVSEHGLIKYLDRILHLKWVQMCQLVGEAWKSVVYHINTSNFHPAIQQTQSHIDVTLFVVCVYKGRMNLDTKKAPRVAIYVESYSV